MTMHTLTFSIVKNSNLTITKTLNLEKITDFLILHMLGFFKKTFGFFLDPGWKQMWNIEFLNEWARGRDEYDFFNNCQVEAKARSFTKQRTNVV
jgi:hypothetical protein